MKGYILLNADGFIGGIIVLVGLPAIIIFLLYWYQKFTGTRFVGRGQISKIPVYEKHESESIAFINHGANKEYVQEAIRQCKRKGFALVASNVMPELEKVYKLNGANILTDIKKYDEQIEKLNKIISKDIFETPDIEKFINKGDKKK